MFNYPLQATGSKKNLDIRMGCTYICLDFKHIQQGLREISVSPAFISIRAPAPFKLKSLPFREGF